MAFNSGYKIRRRGISSILASLFVILIIMSFLASFLAMQRIELSYSKTILRSEEKNWMLSEATLKIDDIKLYSGKLSIDVENPGNQPVLIKYIGVFDKYSKEGSYYNASILNTNIKGVTVNPHTTLINITDLENLNEDLTSGRWEIQLVGDNGLLVSAEYPFTKENVTIGRWENGEYSPIIFNSSVAASGKSPYTEYTYPNTISNITGHHISGDVNSVKYNDSKYYNVSSATSEEKETQTIKCISNPNVTYGSVSGNYTDTWYIDKKWQNITEVRDWLVGWTYRRPITIDNTGNTHNFTNYQIKVTLNTSNFDYSKAKSDGSDIRFTDSDATTLLDYWIQSWDASGTSILWVKVPNIPATSTKTIYIYYGNSSASYDLNHYGLTKIMEPLPADDGPGYKIYYEVWNMSTQLFNPNEGAAKGWHADDKAWSLGLPFSFPYYSNSYSSVHVCSNGFIKATDGYHEDKSKVNTLKEKDMMASFWASLRTDGDSRDIYVNTTYSDQYGDAVYVRWYTTFDHGNGEQNFAIVLYENGLIRFDYGSINGTKGDDITPVIGVSKGDKSHYTLITTNDQELASNWNDHNSIMFWPRKKASTEPAVTVGNEEIRGLDAYYVFHTDLDPNTITGMNITVYGYTSGEHIHLALYNWNTHSWHYLTDITNTGKDDWTNSTVSSGFSDYINSSGYIWLRYNTTAETSEADTVYINYQAIEIEYIPNVISVETDFTTGISSSNLLAIEFNIIMIYNMSNIDINFYLYNFSSSNWTKVYNDSYANANTNAEYKFVVDSGLSYYVNTGSFRLRINSTQVNGSKFRQDINLIGSYVEENDNISVLFVGRGGHRDLYIYMVAYDKWLNRSILNKTLAPFIWDRKNTSMAYNYEGNLLYVMAGNTLYSYNITHDIWTNITTNSSAGEGSSLVYLDSYPDILFYIPGGSSNQTLEYNITENSWNYLKDIPENTTSYTLAIGSSNYIYVAIGDGSANFYRYNVSNDTWYSLEYLPATEINGLAYGQGAVYLSDMGGGIHKYSGTWIPLAPKIPVSDFDKGNHLFIAGNTVIFIRMDSAREIYIIDITKLKSNK